MPKTRIAKNGMPEELPKDFDDLDATYILIHLCFTSPEFGGGGAAARRRIPYQLGEKRESSRAMRLDSFLAVRPWDRDVLAVNAADLTIDWICGTPLIELERSFERLRAGVLRDMYRTLVGHLTGFADVLAGMIVASDSGELSADFAWVSKERGLLFRTVRRSRQISRSVVRGVPEDLLWLADLGDANNRPLCRRPEIIAFQKRNLRTLEEVVDPGRKTELIEALKESGSDPERWKAIRTGAIKYRSARTNRRKASQARRLGKECDDTVSDFYTKRGVPFEEVLEYCFKVLKIRVVGRDDASKKGKSFPDFVLELNGQNVVVECKSAEGSDDISLGDVADVFKKAGVNGLDAEPLVTVCQAYVATDVPRKIETSGRLTVVNAEDLAEALARFTSQEIGSRTIFQLDYNAWASSL